MQEELDYELNLIVDTTKDSVDSHVCHSTEGIASVIRRGNYFAQDKGGRLYYYKNGVYNEGAEKSIELAVVQLLESFPTAISWSTHKGNQVFNYIKIRAPKLLEKPDLNLINLKNGIYNVATGKLQEHTSDYKTTIQLNVEFDPNAKCPAWERIIGEIFPEEDDRQTAFDIPAWLMTPFTGSQKAVVLEGEGNNGKSVYLHGIVGFLGVANTCNVSLQKLGDRFTPTLLIGKLANISPDLPNIKIQSTGEFKALTGGDSLAGEYKHGEQFQFTPFVRCLFACNELPPTPDISDGFYRRLNIIKFERQFEPIPELGEMLKAELTTKQELAGLFNKCVKLLPRIWKSGITVTKKMEVTLDNHRKQNDPVAQWLEETVVFREGEWIEKKELFKEYQRSGNKGSASRSQVWFGRAVMKYVEGVESRQIKVQDSLVTVYMNLTKKTEIDRDGVLEVDLENDPDFSGLGSLELEELGEIYEKIEIESDEVIPEDIITDAINFS